MAKFNLSSSFTSKLFKKSDELTNFEKILQALDKDGENIFRDLDKLEELFLNLNPQKFREKKFRFLLLKSAFGSRRFDKFVLSSGFTPISKNLSIKQKEKFVNKIASFEWKNNDKVRSFVRIFELDEGIIPLETKIQKDLELLKKPDSIYYPMFNYQYKIFDEANMELKFPSRRFLIQIPTGGGKT